MLSSLKDISGAPSFTGGAAAPSYADSGAGSSAGSGDISTGGGSISKATGFPNIYWLGVALLGAAVIYKIYQKGKK